MVIIDISLLVPRIDGNYRTIARSSALRDMLIHQEQSLEEIFSDVKRELKRSTVDKKHPFRYCVLSTQGEHVRSRYVVLRDVVGDFELMIYTDSRSQKTHDISLNNEAQVLVYHPKKQAQVILTGYSKLLMRDELTAQEWKKVKGKAQRAYNTKLAPGTPIESLDEGHQWKEVIDDEYFAVITIRVSKLEVLQLNQSEHIRALFKRKNDWKGQWLVP